MAAIQGRLCFSSDFLTRRIVFNEAFSLDEFSIGTVVAVFSVSSVFFSFVFISFLLF